MYSESNFRKTYEINPLKEICSAIYMYLILRVQQIDILKRAVSRTVPRTAQQVVLQVGNVLVVGRLVLAEDCLQLVELCTLVR